jgi:hypothetical protein
MDQFIACDAPDGKARDAGDAFGSILTTFLTVLKFGT